MRINSASISFWAWSGVSRFFERTNKKLPGRWHLFEYYTENNGELLHNELADLKAQGHNAEIIFDGAEGFMVLSNFSVPVFSMFEKGNWKVSKNYILFSGSDDSAVPIKVQFAIEKGVLRLLKKDKSGRIGFFGFFVKQKA